MLVTDLPFFIDQEQRRNPSEFKKIPFLSIKIRHLVFWIGQPNKGQFFGFPIMLEGSRTIRTDRDNDRVTRGEGRQIIAQMREMGAAVGSHKSAQKDQYNILFS